jgi:hypothetical protein
MSSGRGCHVPKRWGCHVHQPLHIGGYVVLYLSLSTDQPFLLVDQLDSGSRARTQKVVDVDIDRRRGS